MVLCLMRLWSWMCACLMIVGGMAFVVWVFLQIILPAGIDFIGFWPTVAIGAFLGLGLLLAIAGAIQTFIMSSFFD